jgi:hypothetical protein
MTMDNEDDTKAHFNLNDLLLDNKNNKKSKSKKKGRGEYDDETLQKDDFEVS